jgi:tetratricopeptide (TPR) repeat protein
MNNRALVKITAIVLCHVAVSAQQYPVNNGPTVPNRPSRDGICDAVKSCFDRAVAAYNLAGKSGADRKAQLANAQAYASKCIQLGGRSDHRAAECYHIRGKVFYINKNYSASIEDEVQATQIDSSRAEYYWSLGKAYYQAQNFSQAQSAMQKCLDHNPIDKSAVIECSLVLGKSFYVQRQCEKAIAPLEQALKEAKLRRLPVGDQAEILLPLGRAYECVGNEAKAIEAYRAVLDLGGNGDIPAAARRGLENLGKL